MQIKKFLMTEVASLRGAVEGVKDAMVAREAAQEHRVQGAVGEVRV